MENITLCFSLYNFLHVFQKGNQDVGSPLLQGRTEAEIFCKICPWLASILLSLERVLWVSWREGKGANILENLREEGEIFRGGKIEGGWWVLR